jgi:tetratricopeptide (TPR) repeat protein
MPKAREAALRALQLDDSLADAHATLAWIKAFYDYDLASADRDFKRAIELNPGSSLARNNYGIYLAVMNRRDEALRELKRAEEIDPLSLGNKTVLGLPYVYARQYDQAIEQFQRALSMDPNFSYARDMLGVVYGFKGMYREALEEFSKASQISDEPVTLAHTGWAYGLWGKKVEARKALDQLRERSKQEFVLPFSIAMVYVGLGEKDQALDWLEKAYEYRDLILPGLKHDPTWDVLRSEPRFIELLRKAGHSR